MHGAVHITASYAFFPLSEEERAVLQEELRAFGAERGMKGLVLLAPEGINSTVCGSEAAIAEWKTRIRALHAGIVYKDSRAEQMVFRRWSVKRKPELITYRQKSAVPGGAHRHLAPAEWKRMMEREDVVIVDTRNTFEAGLGKFRGAVVPQTRHFTEFPEAVRAAAIPKEKTVLLYCTGGIRCEKAVFTMEEQGYSNVYQLEGGILAYLEQYPNDAFEGECFVFDHRVAVDQHLRPSAVYSLCAECGDPVPGALCTGCAATAAR